MFASKQFLFESLHVPGCSAKALLYLHFIFWGCWHWAMSIVAGSHEKIIWWLLNQTHDLTSTRWLCWPLLYHHSLPKFRLKVDLNFIVKDYWSILMMWLTWMTSYFHFVFVLYRSKTWFCWVVHSGLRHVLKELHCLMNPLEYWKLSSNSWEAWWTLS